MAQQTRVILRSNISSGQVPQFHLWPLRFIKRNSGICYFLFAGQAQTLHILHEILV